MGLELVGKSCAGVSQPLVMGLLVIRAHACVTSPAEVGTMGGLVMHLPHGRICLLREVEILLLLHAHHVALVGKALAVGILYLKKKKKKKKKRTLRTLKLLADLKNSKKKL